MTAVPYHVRQISGCAHSREARSIVVVACSVREAAIRAADVWGLCACAARVAVTAATGHETRWVITPAEPYVATPEEEAL